MIALTAPRFVRIGEGAAEALREVLDLLGARRPLLVVDPYFREAALLRRLAAALEAAGIATASFHGVVPDPTTAAVAEGVAAARAHGADAVVAVGGGSAVDTAKAVALLAVHAVSLRALRAPYRVVERGLPLVAIPTTAGTGSEATRFCLVSDSETGDKMVCVGEGFVPAAALIDPALTHSLPRRLTAETGIDALAHALEAYVGARANPLSDLYAERALVLIARALPALMDDLSDRGARADMMLGSYLAGSAFSASGLALAHAMSAPLGARFHVPHGLSIGLLLPGATRFSIARAPAPYARAARLLGLARGASSDDRRAADALAAWLDGLTTRLDLPTLAGLGIARSDYEAALEAMAEEAPRSGAAANNPVVPTHPEIVALYAGLRP